MAGARESKGGRRRQGRRARRAAVVASLAGILGAGDMAGQSSRPTLEPDDYGRWEALGGYELDPTGTWLRVDIRRVDETREIRVHRTSGSGDPLVLEQGQSAAFSRDGRWLAYRKVPAPDEIPEDGPRPPDRLGLVDLDSGRDTVLFEIRSFAFSDDGAWLAALGPAAADTVGGDLLVFDPGEPGRRTLLGNVEEYAWQDGAARLAATLRTAWGDANGVTLLDPAAGTVRSLDAADARYRSLTWEEDGSRLAVLRSRDLDGRREPTHDVVLWNDPTGPGAPRILGAVGHPTLADTLRVTEHAGIAFSGDGERVYVGVRPWEADPDAETDGPDGASDGGDSGGGQGGDPGPGDDPGEGEGDGAATDSDDDDPGPADVQVWHWNDDQIIRGQEYFASSNARRTLLASWIPAGDRLVVLGDELDEPVRVAGDGPWALVGDYDPYAFERRFGSRSTDWYRVDTRTGARSLLAGGAEAGATAGPAGRRAVVFESDGWTAIDLGSLDRTPLDAPDAAFGRSLADYDHPGPRPPWGVAAWEEEDRAVYLYDKHDVWRADLETGSVRRLTRGAEENVRYRVVNLDPDASFGDPVVVGRGDPLWLSSFDLETKASGYSRCVDGGCRSVLTRDARVVGLRRARDADRFAFRVERWDDSPDVFVAGPDLGDARQVTRTNPFQADYAWGRTELLDYTTDAGHDLQAILVYPADFQEGRRYPLILYQYERLSDGLHAYDIPSERDYYNYQTWSQRGYFVLMPDIVYEPGRPGPSALDAVDHALDAAVATGHVDPERMGLIGHSWGGYQASYLPTRTHRFAASVAGAAITNFVSFMGAVHWNGGLPELGHWETGQARMAVPFWEDFEGHIESSPVHGIDELETPVLLMHGDEDGVVDFRQGLEYYNYARRLGKPVVLLVYPGADHGLREEAQQVDYHRRILEWFGHYLKGEPAAKWITEGESWDQREKRMEGNSGG